MPPESDPQSPESNPPEPQNRRSYTNFEKFLQYPWAGLTALWFGIAGVAGCSNDLMLWLFDFDFTILEWGGGVAALLFIFSLLMAILAFFVSHPPTNKETQDRLLIWGALLFGAGVLLTLPPLISPAVKAAKNAQGNSFVEKTFADGRFSVRVPQSWEPTETAEPQAGVLQLSDPENELQFIAYAAHKADVPVETLSALQRLQTKELSRTLNNVRSEIVMDRKWATPAEIETVLTGSTETMNFWYLLRQAEYGDYWIELRFWTKPSQLEQNGELIAEIADSVQPLTDDSQ